jgi:thioredoxin-related protein
MRQLAFIVALGALVLVAQPPPRPDGDPTYDPKADPTADVARAVAQAAKEKKHVLVDVGGEWCGWCHRMDKFLIDHPDLLATRRKNFVFVKVNFSDENKNQSFLGRYPKIEGYPHLFVLDAQGRLLQSQNTGELEEGKSYNLDKFTAFLGTWGPKP